jgi:hypothetical protein
MSVDGCPDIFVLDAFFHRKSISATQCRAFNLIWALSNSGRITPGRTVGIVGGGASGITAAAAAHVLGCRVSIFERSQKLLGLQLGTHTRRVHPNLDDWPQANFHNPETDFPCLNWCAGIAHDVASQLLHEWDQIKRGDTTRPAVQVHLGCDTKEISLVGGRPAIRFSPPQGDPVSSNFDQVIIAVGYGPERMVKGIESASYWSDPATDELNRTPTGRRRLLVSGTTDPGLLDCLRHAIRDFDREALVAQLLSQDDLLPIKNKLVEIEDEIRKLGGDVPGRALELDRRYKAELTIPERLREDLKGRLRTDTCVTLNSVIPTALHPSATILNRFLIFLLLEMGHITYVPAKLESGRKNDGFGEIGVVLRVGADCVIKSFDDVIVRHGTVSMFPTLLGGRLSLPRRFEEWYELDEPTARRAWPDDFLDGRRRSVPVATERQCSGTASSALDSFPIAQEVRAEQILRRMAVNEIEGVYVLGSFAKRVTFSAQQNRAFNLVWALSNQCTNRVGPGRSVAVVGGGLAGITAAAAAQLLGCNVTLFEERGCLLHLQCDNMTRFIHPNIYDWPESDARMPVTDFPCLNWSADFSSAVVAVLVEQWERLSTSSPRIDVRYRHRVREVRSWSGSPCVVLEQPGFDTLHFDCVILAVGFGVEKPRSDVRQFSYWDNDPLNQHVKMGPIPRRYLVTGCGDGGLIDTMRLSLSGFNHKKFVDDFLPEELVVEIAPALLDIEKESQTIADEANQEMFLFSEYKKLPGLDKLAMRLRPRLRKDTRVVLNGNQITPLSRRACILNRFAVFMLLRENHVRFHRGEVQIEIDSNSGVYKVSFQRPGFQPDEHVHFFDEIIVRHGPQPAICALLPNEIAEEYRSGKRNKDDESRMRLWPESFLADAGRAAYRAELLKSYAQSELPAAKLALAQPGGRDTVEVDWREDSVVFVVTKPAEMSAQTSLPSTFAGVRVVCEQRRPGLDQSRNRVLQDDAVLPCTSS